jgi:hypothetical protein
MLHLSGYPEWTLDQVRNYHAPIHHTMAAGHPEIEFPGIEVTTGPLGQGIANAVGLAVAGKQLGAQYNKDGFPVVDGKIWAMTGDGCIQEGVGMEGESVSDLSPTIHAYQPSCFPRWTLGSGQFDPHLRQQQRHRGWIYRFLFHRRHLGQVPRSELARH